LQYPNLKEEDMAAKTRVQLLNRIIFLLLIGISIQTSSRPGVVYAQIDSSTTISGRVTFEDNSPAAGIIVTNGPVQSSTRWYIDTATTDIQGNYTLKGLPPGLYRIFPKMPNYCMKSERGYITVTLHEGEAVKGADFQVVVGGTISGRAMDVNKNPLPDSEVRLLRVDKNKNNIINEIRIIRTDDKGNYTISNIYAGYYLVSVCNKKKTEGFFPKARTNDDAQVIEVYAGSKLTNIDITLGPDAPEYQVTGMVVDAETGDPISNMPIAYDHSFMAIEQVVASRTDSQGKFRITGLDPGSYWVSLLQRESGDYYSRHIKFDITNHDISNLIIEAGKGITVKGRVLFYGIDQATLIKNSNAEIGVRYSTYNLIQNYKDNSQYHFDKIARLQSDDTFEIKGLPPEDGSFAPVKYMSMMNSLVNYPFSVVLNGVNVTKETVLLKQPSSDLKIMISSGGEKIEGLVKVNQGSPNMSSLTVTAELIKDSTTCYNGSTLVQPDGHFSFSNLPEGDYLVRFLSQLRKATVKKGLLVNVVFEMN
jgi:hypothetical protein